MTEQSSAGKLYEHTVRMEKPVSAIPAFYACYLLRSTVRHASQYIGSTPHPKRRLGQHNGEAVGGAARTARDNLRPWEMACLVTGFPSKVAALQFEWAWQNTHLTRHVAPGSRLTHAKATINRISPKTGRARKRSARPRMSLTDRLANLHLLLRAGSFERWPLSVRFYSEDVFRVWERWTKQQIEKLRPGIVVALDESATRDAHKGPSDISTVSGIQAIDVGYSALKPYLEKSQKAFENAEWLHCAVCKGDLPASGAMTVVCPSEGCTALSHIECLSASFLESSRANTDALVPTSGQCPSCGTHLQWVDLVKELSLRMPRGEKEMKVIFKKRRMTKKQSMAAADADEIPSPDDDDEDLDDQLPDDDDDDDDDDNVNDDWHDLAEDSDVEMENTRIRNDPSSVTKPAALVQPTTRATFSEPIIGDSEDSNSDWDNVETIT